MIYTSVSAPRQSVTSCWRLKKSDFSRISGLLFTRYLYTGQNSHLCWSCLASVVGTHTKQTRKWTGRWLGVSRWKLCFSDGLLKNQWLDLKLLLPMNLHRQCPLLIASFKVSNVICRSLEALWWIKLTILSVWIILPLISIVLNEETSFSEVLLLRIVGKRDPDPFLWCAKVSPAVWT